MTTLDPFQYLKGVFFAKKTWCLWENGHHIGVEPDDGAENIRLSTWITPFAGFAVAGVDAFSMRFGSEYFVQYNNIETGAWGSWATNIGFDDVDDCASDGVHLYVSGADTSDGSSTFRVSKFDLATKTRLWVKNLGTYPGGAIAIAANPGGFMLYTTGVAKFYDADGNYLGQDTTIVDALSYEWCACATRDRFYIVHKLDFSATGVVQLRCYNGSGAIQYSINGLVPAGTAKVAPAVTERHVMLWVESSTAVANNHVIAIPRTVVRDGSGNITSDTLDTPSAATWDLGTTIPNLRKACVDASTFLRY